MVVMGVDEGEKSKAGLSQVASFVVTHFSGKVQEMHCKHGTSEYMSQAEGKQVDSG